MKADLHMHSTRSDGTMTPKELKAFVESLQVTDWSLTDHDTYEGLDDLDTLGENTALLPGIELSLKPLRSFHACKSAGTESQAQTAGR